MNRFTYLIAMWGGVALAIVPALAEAPVQQGQVTAIPETFQGTIVSVEKNELKLSTADGEKSFFVVDEAVVLLNGVESTIAELNAGYFATVTAEQNDQQWLVNFVHAKRQM